MKDNFGTDPKNLVAFVGPAAGKCCYEVGDEVAGMFDGAFIAKNESGKWKVDLKNANRHQIASEGVLSANIEVHDGCTIHESEKYHSYRRDGESSGRMMGVIGIVR